MRGRRRWKRKGCFDHDREPGLLRPKILPHFPTVRPICDILKDEGRSAYAWLNAGHARSRPRRGER